MNLKQQIDKEEEKFFFEEIRSPSYLIMRPEAREELKFLIAEEEGVPFEEVLVTELNSYKGLQIAVSFRGNFPNFVLC